MAHDTAAAEPPTDLKAGDALITASAVLEQNLSEPEKQKEIAERCVDADSKDLPRKADSLTIPILIVLVVGGLERAAFYAVTAPWQNYMQNDLDGSHVSGALGLGQSRATAVSNAYMVFASLTPIPLAVIADLWLGRYKTLVISLSLGALGCIVQLITSIPALLRSGGGPAGLGLAMVLIGIGTGGIKSVFSPFLGDQCSQHESRVVEKPDGNREVVDYRLTLQFMYNVFYGITNFACLSIIPSTFLERTTGFWAAYLLATACTCTGLVLLLATSHRLVKILPGDNILVPMSKVLSCAARNGFNLSRAKSEYQSEHHGHVPSYSDAFVDEVGQTLHTCRVLLSFAIFYLCANQMNNNLVSQAGQMQLSGVPNDMIPSFASIACILFAPLLQAFWSYLARRKITLSALFQIELSFVLCAIAIGFASLTQHLIYDSPPCYDQPRKCGVTAGPNRISVWVQLPTYIIAALAETIGFVIASEYAYSHSPQNAKSMIQAFSQVAAALGSILGLATSPAARDPWLVIYYAALAGGMLVAAIGFWWLFGKGWKRDGIDEAE
ncbi:putative peptide transporter ptr2 [Pseudocercospora fuligena]|uniref:Putative peptide transporter ptr2 n=1 Tax=Pseudocercospora fuligena TaxID=685502 RepID=A0A8H6VBG8_9PEZI|nr:putative peptide transporter ptr2 [Pseudocercospora fuligena]